MSPDIEQVTGALRDDPRIDLAILFGSAVRGALRADSDLDVAIRWRDIDDREQVHRDYLTFLGRLIELAHRDVHLIDLDHAAPALVRQVFETGRVLVDRDPRRTRIFHAKKLIAHFDGQYARRIIDASLDRRLKRAPSHG